MTPAPVWDALLDWYARQGRDLPWRQTRDPYAILVSEIMLQQTQVDRVLPKFREFLGLFQTFAALAEASTDSVIRAWSPLGYNQRAVRLQQIARVVVEQHDGQMPQTLEGLLSLPGIGRYTAGAIACFALGQAVATVDTNIRRVLTRVFIGELSEEATRTEKPEVALKLAEDALPPEATRAYDWNQALMDLGATVCLARTPACDRCPLATVCATYAQMQQYTLFPTGEALRDILQSRRVAETSASYTPRKTPENFKTSNRFYRGRVVAALRDLPMGATLDLTALGPLVKPDYTSVDRLWLITVVEGLVRDRLAVWANEAQTEVTLPK